MIKSVQILKYQRNEDIYHRELNQKNNLEWEKKIKRKKKIKKKIKVNKIFKENLDGLTLRNLDMMDKFLTKLEIV